LTEIRRVHLAHRGRRTQNPCGLAQPGAHGKVIRPVPQNVGEGSKH
jgi:hypothetical protein